MAALTRLCTRRAHCLVRIVQNAQDGNAFRLECWMRGVLLRQLAVGLGAVVLISGATLGRAANPDPIALTVVSGENIAVLEQEGEVSVIPARASSWSQRRR